MFWKRDHSVIHVEYIDAETGQTTGHVKLPIGKLPASFETQTTLERNGRTYSVVRADPMTAAEFRRSGKLRLVIRAVKIEHADPREMLFSLPTIADPLPAIVAGSSKLGKNVLDMRDDDWRQREFVSLSQQELVDRHLAAVGRIYEQEREGIGFRKIHVRADVASPLAPATPGLEEVVFAGGAGLMRLDGVSFDGVAGIASDVFAMRLLCGIELYGSIANDRIMSLCLGDARPNNAPLASAIAPLIDLARRHGLCLVDWQRARQIDCAQMLAYFEELR